MKTRVERSVVILVPLQRYIFDVFFFDLAIFDYFDSASIDVRAVKYLTYVT